MTLWDDDFLSWIPNVAQALHDDLTRTPSSAPPNP
jgi:hypothetical protein